MNLDHIFETLNNRRVAYLLVGGMNFLLRHTPVLTYDVDLWLEDTPENLRCCEEALCELEAEWGASEVDWGPIADKASGWLANQTVFCLTSPHGAIDVFRSMKGLGLWSESRADAISQTTAGGVHFFGLSDEDMLRCQMALPESSRKVQRVRVLKQALDRIDGDTPDG